MEHPNVGHPFNEECFEIAEKVIERDLCHMTTYAFDFETAHFSDRNSEIAQNSNLGQFRLFHHYKVVFICHLVTQISFEDV